LFLFFCFRNERTERPHKAKEGQGAPRRPSSPPPTVLLPFPSFPSPSSSPYTTMKFLAANLKTATYVGLWFVPDGHGCVPPLL
jgi:hypothetical protein